MPKNPLSILPEAKRPAIDDSMPTMPTTLADLNRMVHEPARLAILTILSAHTSADFTFLQMATGLSKGNLSVQLTRLEEASFIVVKKIIAKKRTLTTVGLTSLGRSAFAQYWEQMERIRSHAVPDKNSAQKPAGADIKIKPAASVLRKVATVPQI